MGKQCELGQSDDHTASLSTQCSVTPKRVEYPRSVGVYRHADTQSLAARHTRGFLLRSVSTTFQLLRPHSCTAYVGEAINVVRSGKMARKLRLQGRTFVTAMLALASVATFSGSFTVNKGMLRATKFLSLHKQLSRSRNRRIRSTRQPVVQIAATIGAEAHSYSWGL